MEGRRPRSSANAATIPAPTRFVAPITLTGLTALSVETMSNFATLRRIARCVRLREPQTWLFTSSGECYAYKRSISGSF